MPYQFSVFRNAQGEAEYLAAYDEALANWPVPFEEQFVPTRFGPAHIITCGPKQAPPLLLLQGMGLSVPNWEPWIARLSASYRVYAPDLVNDLGKTALDRTVQDRDDYVVWLGDLLDSLRNDTTSVIGHSIGGWLGMSFALYAPRRVIRLVAVSPAASLFNYPFSFQYQIFRARLRPTNERACRLLDWLSADGSAANGMASGMFRRWLQEYHPPRFVTPTAFTDEEMRKISIPALLLFGEQDALCRAEKAAGRAARWMPRVTTGIIPGAGHWAAVDRPAETCARALEFLDCKNE